MKAYVQYFDYDLAGEISPVLGDRGVVILDGRNNLETWHEDAREFNGFRRPLYVAYQIMRGDFRKSSPISEIIML